jgi:hypothetical protein
MDQILDATAPAPVSYEVSRGGIRSTAKRLATRHFLVYAIVTLILWTGALYVRGGKFLEHEYMDQHTLQAMAWGQGKMTLDGRLDQQEIAMYKGQFFVSFPPTPTLLEYPLTRVFGRHTPNVMVLILSAWLAMLLSCLVIYHETGNRRLAILGGLCFFWGSNVFYLSLKATVWHQGQVLGVLFATFALASVIISSNRLAIFLAGVSLGLAVGCRPFYLFVAIYCLYSLAVRFRNRTGAAHFLYGLAPVLADLSLYNYARFDSFTEFGHKYLMHSISLSHGIFSVYYLKNNLYHAMVQPPMWDRAYEILGFSGAGTSVLFVTPFAFLGLDAIFSRQVDRWEKLALCVPFVIIWSMLLLHESNGWFQFGYRYSVDLIPLLMVMFAKSFRRINIPILLVGAFSLVMNVYGALWFYCLSHSLL